MRSPSRFENETQADRLEEKTLFLDVNGNPDFCAARDIHVTGSLTIVKGGQTIIQGPQINNQGTNVPGKCIYLFI